jgi:hypothetical protein
MIFGISESPDWPSLWPATKKRNGDKVEADMAEMSSMSESEILTVIEERAIQKRRQFVRFLYFCSSTQGEVA